MEITLQLRCALVCPVLQYRTFHDARITFFCGTFALRTEITLQLRFVFIRRCDVFLIRRNYVIYLLDEVTFFDDIRITLYFGTVELPTEITL